MTAARLTASPAPDAFALLTFLGHVHAFAHAGVGSATARAEPLDDLRRMVWRLEAGLPGAGPVAETVVEQTRLNAARMAAAAFALAQAIAARTAAEAPPEAPPEAADSAPPAAPAPPFPPLPPPSLPGAAL